MPLDLSRLKLAAEALVPWIQVVALTAGGMFALCQYQGSVADARIARSIALCQRYSQGNLLAARGRIESAWNAIEPELITFVNANRDLPPKQKEDGWRTLVLAVVQGADLKHDILTLVDYFEEAAACMDAQLCDPHTVRQFLGTRANEFYNTHYCYIVTRRRETQDPSFARGVEQIIRRQSNDSCGVE